MPDESNIQRILAYVDQYRSQYDLSVLREQLLAAGYTADDVEAAFARLPQQTAPTIQPEQTAPTIQPEQTVPAATPESVIPAGPPPEAEAEIKRMVSYLLQHRDRYSIDSLRAQLLATGQPPALVEAALGRVQAGQPVKKQAVWPLGLAIAVLNLLLLPLVIGVLVTAVNQFSYTLSSLLFWLWPLALVGELIAGIILRNGPRERLGRALLYGVLFSIVIPIVLAILLAGVCLIILAGSPGLFR